MPIRTGPEHHNWKGGRTYSHEYVIINIRHDPLYADKKSSQMLEHRYVMEKHLGRSLKSTELVHHINGIKTDNRIENLQVMSWKDHTADHHPLKGKKLSKRWINCFQCGTQTYSAKNKVGYKMYCSNKCAGIARRGIRTSGPIKKRKCPFCKKKFEPIFNSEKSRFCSIACANKSRGHTLLERKCPQCGKRFFPSSKRNSSKQRFCSISCGGRHRHNH